MVSLKQLRRPVELLEPARYARAVIARGNPTRRRSVLAATLIAAAIGGVVAWFAASVYYVGAAAPSALGVTIDAQRAEILRRATSVYSLQLDGRRWYHITGPLAPRWTLPSGPPCYILDETGRVEEWTADVGDSPDFRERWPIDERAIRLTAEEAAQIVWR